MAGAGHEATRAFQSALCFHRFLRERMPEGLYLHFCMHPGLPLCVPITRFSLG